MGCAASVEVSPLVEAPAPCGWTMVGDCLSVAKKRGLWVRARVVATAESEMHGSMILVHLEGYRDSDLLWLHKEEDHGRLRPLITNMPDALPSGTGPRGPDKQERFTRIVQAAQRKVMAGKPWLAPSQGAPSIFSVVGKRFVPDLTLSPEAWLESQQKITRTPFITSSECCKYRPFCLAMYEAVISGAKPPGLSMETPLNITASGLMVTPGGEFVIENPSINPPSPVRDGANTNGGRESGDANPNNSALDRRLSLSRRSDLCGVSRLPIVEEEHTSRMSHFSKQNNSSRDRMTEMTGSEVHERSKVGASRVEAPEQRISSQSKDSYQPSTAADVLADTIPKVESPRDSQQEVAVDVQVEGSAQSRTATGALTLLGELVPSPSPSSSSAADAATQGSLQTHTLGESTDGTHQVAVDGSNSAAQGLTTTMGKVAGGAADEHDTPMSQDGLTL